MRHSFIPQLFIVCFFCSVASFAQNVTITPGGITPALSGTYPRLSYDAIAALPSPQTGDIAYDLTFLCLRVYNGSKWICTYKNPDDTTPTTAAIATISGGIIQNGLGIAVDASGNIYTTGYFAGTADFGGISKISANYDNDIYIAKYNGSGTLQWVQTAGGLSADFGTAIALDANGNVYVTGSFQGTANFGGTNKSSAGQADIFVAKYNNSGTFQWVQTAGGLSADLGQGLTIDGSGSVYITGYFAGTANFGGTNKSSLGSNDIFIVKYDTGGTIQWIQTAGGTGEDSGNGIGLDGSGNVYITGYFQGTAYFGGTPKGSVGSYDIFLAKYNPVGISWTWIQTPGGTGDDKGQALIVDASGNSYFTGSFSGTANFGGNSKISAGNTDIYVAKYNTSGICQWVQSAGGTEAEYGIEIGVDASGNSYITGYFTGTANFGGTSKTSAGGIDMYVAKYDTFGIFQWVQVGGGTGVDYANAVTVNGTGIVYATGSFSGTAKFGVNSKTATGSSDAFIVKIQQ